MLFLATTLALAGCGDSSILAGDLPDPEQPADEEPDDPPNQDDPDDDPNDDPDDDKDDDKDDPQPSPNVIFYEDWRTGDRSRWDDNTSDSRHSVVRDQAYTGTHALRIRVPAGGDSGWLTKFIEPGHDEIYVRARYLFGPGWTSGTRLMALRGGPEGQRWAPFGKSGTCPTGHDFFRVGYRMENRQEGTGPLTFYNYWHGMNAETYNSNQCWGRYGDRHGAEYRNVARIQTGRWVTIEIHGVLNEPGKSNGSLRLWQDGELRIEWRNVDLRKSDRLKFNSVQLDIRSAERAPNFDRVLYVDDILVLDGLPANR